MGNPPSQATVETKPETTLLPVEVVQAPSVPVAAEQQVATAFSDAGANADAQGIQDPAQWADDELPIAGEMLDAWTTSALAETKTAPDLPGYEQTALDNMGSGDVWFCPTTAWLAGVSGNRHTRMLTAAIGQHYLRFAQANFTDTPGSAVAFEKPWTADSLLGQMEEGFSRLCDPRNIRPVARHAKDWVFAKEDPAGIAALRIFANGAPVTTRDLRLFARLRRNGEIPNSALLSLIVEPKKIMNAVYERYPNSRRELVNCIRLAMRVLHDRDRDDDAAAVIYRHFGNRDAMTAEFAAFEDMDAAVLAGDADKAFMEAIRVGQKALKRRLYVQPWLRAIWNRVIPAFFLEHCYPERLWLADVRTAHAHVLNLYSLFNNAK
jgi:hypothetical protein